MDWLTATRSFCNVIELGSFTAAGVRDNISASAVSKRIDWLEKQLAVSLMIRTTRHVSMTEAGINFQPKAQSLLKQFNNMVSETRDEANEPSGLLKITASTPIGEKLLMAHINTFLQRHKKVKIQLDNLAIGVLPDLDHDLIFCKKQNEFDSANHKGMPLKSYDMGIFASPGYLQQHATINTVEDLSKHPFIISRYQQKKGYEILNDHQQFRFNHYAFVSDNIDAILYAVKQHMGLTFAPKNVPSARNRQ